LTRRLVTQALVPALAGLSDLALAEPSRPEQTGGALLAPSSEPRTSRALGIAVALIAPAAAGGADTGFAYVAGFLRAGLVPSLASGQGHSLPGAADAALFQMVLSALTLWSGLILMNELRRVNGLVWAIFIPPR
jgi:hypothetical protein